jgi:hypothetical protein
MVRDKLDSVILFRVSACRKAELEAFAQDVDMSMSKMLRKMTETVEILFDPHLSFSDVVRSMSELKKTIASRRV